MENIRLAFRYSELDYVRAMRSHYATRLRLPLDVVVIVVLASSAVYLLRSGSEMYGAIFLGTDVIFVLLLIAAFAVIPQLAFRREAKFRDEYVLDFSPQTINFRTAHINSDLQWSMYTSALVDKHSYILYYGSTQFTVIPKRVFQDASQREQFEQLLTRKVLKTVDKTK